MSNWEVIGGGSIKLVDVLINHCLCQQQIDTNFQETHIEQTYYREDDKCLPNQATSHRRHWQAEQDQKPSVQ